MAPTSVYMLTDTNFRIFGAPRKRIPKICTQGPTNPVQLNRRCLALMGRLNVLPYPFELEGKRRNGSVSKLRWICWKIQLALSVLYALYINATLIVNVSSGLDAIEKLDLGTHLTRAMLSANFSYWAYQIFVAYFSDQAMLYLFAQSNPGDLLVFSSVFSKIRL